MFIICFHLSMSITGSRSRNLVLFCFLFEVKTFLKSVLSFLWLCLGELVNTICTSTRRGLGNVSWKVSRRPLYESLVEGPQSRKSQTESTSLGGTGPCVRGTSLCVGQYLDTVFRSSRWPTNSRCPSGSSTCNWFLFIYITILSVTVLDLHLLVYELAYHPG